MTNQIVCCLETMLPSSTVSALPSIVPQIQGPGGGEGQGHDGHLLVRWEGLRRRVVKAKLVALFAPFPFVPFDVP